MFTQRDMSTMEIGEITKCMVRASLVSSFFHYIPDIPFLLRREGKIFVGERRDIHWTLV